MEIKKTIKFTNEQNKHSPIKTKQQQQQNRITINSGESKSVILDAWEKKQSVYYVTQFWI